MASVAVHAGDCKPRARSSVCGHLYRCPGCERLCGWCFGAADELGELCDDCAAHVWDLREAALDGEGATNE
jgi:hypothetical protein